MLRDEDHSIHAVQIEPCRVGRLELHPVEVDEEPLTGETAVAVEQGVAEAPLTEDRIRPIDSAPGNR